MRHYIQEGRHLLCFLKCMKQQILSLPIPPSNAFTSRKCQLHSLSFEFLLLMVRRAHYYLGDTPASCRIQGVGSWDTSDLTAA